jgi:UDP-4-amino-4,6-dideoxy-N-acetyl-beta-L-altrosamine N-acetyltransferase
MVSDGKMLIRLSPLVDLDMERQMTIRDIRNEPGVRKWMYTDHIISASEHLTWINRLKSDDQQIVLAVLINGTDPVGVVSINAIDRLHKKADWAFYLSQAMAGQGIGSALEYAIIEFAFHAMGLEKLNCEVIENNDAVVRLHRKFMFQQEGFRRINIVKNGERIGVYFMGLTAEDWNQHKPEQPDRHVVVFDLQANPKRSDTVIDLIESARARNNLNWMNILRLAIDKAPSVAKPLVAEIHNTDAEINQLSQELFQ